MKKIHKIRLISHNFGAVMASIGLYLLFLSLLLEPNLLSNPIQKILYITYLSLYPILLGLVIVEDIILLRKKPSWRQ